ncbi:MAG TPA: TetR/AcrR family transcriptional regulator [Candidatus Dormibacteraeota bacterium]|jgi:AcrR family transcriptional regulator|nr:TetR/AcrR family transcriptional regulator [Candidatus Dormibacteraeota bacterium]HEX2680842.1 TetR/AcrR family transcriptional regulator [Candidatus Dormibacteraeota bacterium]
MARTLNAAVYTVRREAFVDAGLRLMQAKGYEQMSIQDVLDSVDASRGAFYHYFDSKQALLGAMVDRIADQALTALSPVVEDPNLPAIPKLERFFGGIAQFKTDRKALMVEFIKVWKSDFNAIVREKVKRVLVERVAAILARIVEQGVREGVFHIDAPAETATILMMLMTGFQDAGTDLFLARQANHISFEEAERALSSFVQAFERILGAREGSIRIVDDKTIQEWFG